MIREGHVNRPGTKLEALHAVIIHYTANNRPGANAAFTERYFGRKYAIVDGKPFEIDGVGNVMIDPKTQMPVPFRYASTQIACDQTEVVEMIPTDEVAWACGDRPMPWDETWKGQQHAARYIFGNRQNYRSISVEICNNVENKDPARSWAQSVATAREWVARFIRCKGLQLLVSQSIAPETLQGPPAAGTILLMRHHDVTGKICPKAFVDNRMAWIEFVNSIATELDKPLTRREEGMR